MVSHFSKIMAKIYPQESTRTSSSVCSSRSSCSSSMISSDREVYTVWMKSLVCHSNGCTTYDSKGCIVYRVENYDHKSSNEVHLMDFGGKVLCTIRRKKYQLLGRWVGYRYCGSSNDKNKEIQWFQVRKYCRVLMGDLACQVTVGRDKYWIVRSPTKTAFKIINIDKVTVAEVKPKQSTLGVALGDDVLTLVVEAKVDCSLVMSLVVVNGLINHKL